MSRMRMSGLKQVQWGLGLAGVFLALANSAQSEPLTAGQPIALEQTRGRFDFIRIDTARHRLLLAHTENKTLDVFDINSRKLLKSVPAGAAADAAVDAKNGRYYASVGEPPRMAIVDATTLEMIGDVPLPAPADLMGFNAVNGMAYVCNDTAPELWVIDPQAKKIVNTITLSGKGMEDMAFDPQYKRLFQAVKTGDLLVAIDPSNNKILGSWPTAPATNPHGIALVPDADTILVSGANGKLTLLNRSTGKVLASATIVPKADEMAYDPQLHTAYCASGQGKISVVDVKADGLNALGDVTTSAGARSIVVDPETHTVWIAYGKDDRCFVQPFTTAK
jgi:DNA-binding beta-propeller fold protein YncE